MCTVSPLTGWRTSSLTTTGLGEPPSTVEVEHRAGVGQRDGAGRGRRPGSDRILAAAVDDAGNVALAAQAARLAGAAGLARGDLQGWWICWLPWRRPMVAAVGAKARWSTSAPAGTGSNPALIFDPCRAERS